MDDSERLFFSEWKISISQKAETVLSGSGFSIEVRDAIVWPSVPVNWSTVEHPSYLNFKPLRWLNLSSWIEINLPRNRPLLPR